MYRGLRDARGNGFRRSFILFARLLVSGGVEGNEENQVRAQSRTAGESRKLLPTAFANVGKGREINTSSVVVSCIINKSY